MQTHYGVLSSASKAYFEAKETLRRRKAYLCVYAQLALLESERSLLVRRAQPVVFVKRSSSSYAVMAAAAAHEPVGEIVPLLGWELMREFFQAYCGVPELLLLSSRQFQHDMFHNEVRELCSKSKSAYVSTWLSLAGQ